MTSWDEFMSELTNDPRTNDPRRPATRIGRYLLFPSGHVVKLSRREQLLYALGLRDAYLSTTPERRSL